MLIALTSISKLKEIRKVLLFTMADNLSKSKSDGDGDSIWKLRHGIWY